MKIPYLTLPDKPLTATSQKHLPLADITEDIALYKDGGAAIVLESTSLNFGLLSEKEQQAVIAAYAALLNSLSFPIQIIVRSQRKDISNYLKYLDEAAQKIQNPKLAYLMKDYRQFITETVKKKNVLGKRFYLAIPFSPLELGVTKSILTTTRGTGPLPFPKKYVIKKAKVILYPKRDHLIRQVGRLSIKLRQLSTTELIALFFDIYNPKKPAIKSKEEEVQ
ncbi:hypothetical protein KAT60_02585 [Candidatus Woesebacteria bacterium]|nr:hypothetical protein [Candidatus Woesebacteria bacterium]